jgi:hypothetical protein
MRRRSRTAALNAKLQLLEAMEGRLIKFEERVSSRRITRGLLHEAKLFLAKLQQDMDEVMQLPVPGS